MTSKEPLMTDQIQCRIVDQSTKTEWDFYGAINDYNFYLPLIEELHRAQPQDLIMLKIGSGGGCVDVGFVLVEAIRATAAVTVAHVVRPSASMASIIACACNGLVMNKNTNLMFHAYSGGSYGKADDVVQDVTRNHRLLTAACKDVVCPFISPKELMEIENGRDKYIEWDDVDLAKRLKRHFKFQIKLN